MGRLPLPLLLVSAVSLLAQTASLTGFVRDSSGAVVPEARITLTQKQQNLRFTAVTDGAGFYRLPVLPIGFYDLEAGKAGFKQVRQTGVELTVDQRASLDLNLEVGQVSESVNVEA
ncbi:MAG: carboxypeptidase-like regulatory domain-containing protein, partial [Bryobacteraceae bacterium]